MLLIGWRASAVRAKKLRFRQEAGVSIVVAGGPRSVTDTLTLDSQVA